MTKYGPERNGFQKCTQEIYTIGQTQCNWITNHICI